MKHFLTFLLLLCSYMLCGAQVATLVVDNQTPGWLSSKINYGDQLTVNNLTVTGYINQNDLTFIGDLMSKHSLSGHLDLSDVEIVDTKFADLPTSGGTLTMFQLSQKVSINRFSLPKSLAKISPYLLAKVQADTLDYGGENCNVLTKLLITNRYYSTTICPKVLVLREGLKKIETFGTDEGNEKRLETIILPQTVDSIGNKAFVSCSNLSHVNLPEGIHTIGNYAFAGSSFKPDTLRLPSQLKIYHTRSFPRNPGQVIIIPENTAEFDNAEGGDYSLDLYSGIDRYTTYSFVINRVQPPRFRSQYGPHYVDLESCNIYVPKQGLSLYKDINFNSSVYGDGGNPYSYATVFPISVPVESVTLNFQSYVLNVGNTLNLFVTINPINADNPHVTWQSSDTNIAQVNESGRITALSSGQCTIKVISNENPTIFALCELTVRQPLLSITLNPKSITLNAGQTYDGLSLTYYPTTADNKSIIWQSSNPEVVTVDSQGKVNAIQGGEAKIIVMSVENNNIKDECTVTVLQPTTGISLDKSEIEIIEDESIQIIATVLPENATNKSVNWTSSDISVAMVSPDGTVYALKAGQATVMATTIDGGFVALCKVTVRSKTIQISNIELSSNSESIAVGETLQLNAIISPDNASNKTIIWTSTNSTIASVNASGLVTAISEGNTKIIASATDDSGVSAECAVVVSEFGGIDEILADKSVYVRIFNLKGVLVYEGIYSDATLLPDYYIVVCDGKNIKVRVK